MDVVSVAQHGQSTKEQSSDDLTWTTVAQYVHDWLPTFGRRYPVYQRLFGGADK